MKSHNNGRKNVIKTMNIEKTMKSSTTKVVIVKINKKKSQIAVDSEIFDDIYIEAATRAVEKYKIDMSFFDKIRIVGEAYIKEDEQNLSKHYQINMYHIMINAGLHALAESLRDKTRDIHRIDLQLEPAIAHAGKCNK